jgi:GNAT superfamily N-acetyltransferase
MNKDWAIALIGELTRTYDGLQLSVILRADGDYVVLSKLIVPERSRGVGTAVMTAITAAADEHGTSLALTPDLLPGTTSKARLVRFYRRFGFIPNKGRSKDFTIQEAMIRPPRS